MTCEEFSNEFDTLFSSYLRIRKFDDKQSYDTIELDEYEKSIFLTRSQEELIVELYSGKNPFRDSFDSSEEVKKYLAPHIKGYKATEAVTNATKLYHSTATFTLPTDVLYVVYEEATLNISPLSVNALNVEVKPCTYDDYHFLNKNPFKGPNINRVLRLDLGSNQSELSASYPITTYSMRYIAKLSPIILFGQQYILQPLLELYLK